MVVQNKTVLLDYKALCLNNVFRNTAKFLSKKCKQHLEYSDKCLKSALKCLDSQYVNG